MSAETVDMHETLLHSSTLSSRRATHRYYMAFGLTCAGFTGAALALTGLSWWYKADYFHHEGPYPSGWVGYDVFTFVGLVFFTAFSSISVTIMYTGVSLLMRMLNNNLGIAVFATLGCCFITCGSLGMIWGNETMRCFGVFCVNKNKYIEEPSARPEAGLGFLSVIGSAAFLSLVPMGTVIVTQTLIKIFQIDKSWMERKKKETNRPKIRTLLQRIIVTFLIIIFAITTFYLPNSWEYFTSSRIANNAQLLAVRNASLCNEQWKKFTCPELPSSWVFTRNWVWSDSLVLKMYPSNIFFFSYLLLVLLLVSGIRANRVGRSLMKRRCPSLLHDFTYGEAGFAVLTVLMLLLFFAYWVSGHNFKSYWNGTDANIARSERWARSLGQLAVAFLSLCMFPASRYSVLHSILGTSWESSLWVHRVLGYGMLFATLGHMVAWYVRYGEMGLLPQGVFSIPPVSPPAHTDNFAVPLITPVTWFMFLAIGVFALEPVRRRFFELFYYLHLFTFYMIVPCVLWHAAASWEYMLPGLTVWFVDRVVRMYRSASRVEVVSASAGGSFVAIRFRHATLSAAPGQYAFVNIPELSLLQWHPFSLGSSCDGCFTFHIKSMGEGTWTGRLVRLVEERGADFTMSVDGPCGRVQDYADYKAVVLVAGGIGVTPCASIYNHFRRQKCVTGKGPAVSLLWTLRDAELLPMMSHLWEELDPSLRQPDNERKGPYMPLRLFYTGSALDANKSIGEDVSMAVGRPLLEVEMLNAMCGADGRDVLVFACGPTKFLTCVREAALSLGVDYHSESFFF